MPHHNYLIIGGGMTAAAAIAGIREVDRREASASSAPNCTPPYDTTAALEGALEGSTVESIWRKTDGTG